MTEKIYAETGMTKMPKSCDLCKKRVYEIDWRTGCGEGFYCEKSKRSTYLGIYGDDVPPTWCPLRKGILATVIDENTVEIDGRVFKGE